METIKNNIVYIVSEEYEYGEGKIFNIVGIFSTIEKAKEAYEKALKNGSIRMECRKYTYF